MAWTTPLTAVANATLTAAQWNASVRDNLLETAVAKATTAGRIFVATGTNSIVERAIASQEINTSQTTTSTSYADLATVGPQVTVTTGTQAVVWWEAQMSNSSSATATRCGVAVSGATTLAASDNQDNYIDGLPAANQLRASTFQHFNSAAGTALTAGSNTFTMKYKVSSGTGSYTDRQLLVMAL